MQKGEESAPEIGRGAAAMADGFCKMRASGEGRQATSGTWEAGWGRRGAADGESEICG